MQFTLTTLLTVVSAAQFALKPEELVSWNQLTLAANQISDSACAGEIKSSMAAADGLYNKTGLSLQFIETLNVIKNVSGDVPEAENYRALLSNVTLLVKTSFKDAVQHDADLKAAAIAAKEAAAKAKADEAAAKANGGDKKEEEAVQVQYAKEDEADVFGVAASGALTAAFSVFAVAASLLL